MRKFILLVSFVFLFKEINIAQVQQSMSAADIQLALKKLNTLGSVLYIAAHPDDENTRLIGYMAKERCFRTGYLSITRGDGGQNLIGTEQGEALGLVRTNELLQARKIDGGEQFFTRANDFGYSKSPEETFQFWDKEKTLGDVVWVIRNFKPDVIICRFPTTGEGGHGHHTASAILAEEAFDAAADPARFPEQLKFVKPWKTQRLFWNTFNFGGTNTTSADQLKIDVGIYNPLIGKGYGELSSESRSMHKSQGFGSARTRGTMFEYFKQLKGEKVINEPFENITTTWNRIDNTGKIKSMIANAQKQYDVLSPASTIKNLNEVYDAINQLPDNDSTSRWKELKLKEIENILISASGLWMEAYGEFNRYCPGDSMKMTSIFISRLASDAKVNGVSFLGRNRTKISDVLTPSFQLNQNDTFVFRVKISDSLSSSNPYWLNTEHPEGSYAVADLELIGRPLNEEALKVKFFCEIGGHNYDIVRPVAFKSTDPVKGEIYQPLEMLPPATINFSEKAYIFNNGGEKTITCIIKANKNNVSGKLKFNNTGDWIIQSSTLDFTLKNKGDEQLITCTIKPRHSENSSFNLQAALSINNKTYSKSITRIEYDHIPHQFILSEANVKLVSLNINTIKKRVGYIEGAGDNVAESLQQLGYQVTELTDEKLSNEPLDQYQAIVTGIRAYNTKERLQVHYEKLMKYIEQGGTLIVQYNTNSRVGPVQAKIGPYPFSISRDRVTDEHAKVTPISPLHKLITSPNKIKEDDFDGWIQERGIYFASVEDSNYVHVLELNDAGEKPLNGSLIVADYGKGHFIYTGLAFFRQLPAGVPGAYRLFANLIEY